MELYKKIIASKKVKTAVLLSVTVLYFLGLIAFIKNTALGTILWAAALIPSILIYIYEKQVEREESVRKAEEEAQKAKEEAQEEAEEAKQDEEA